MGWGVAFFDDMESMLRAYTEMSAVLHPLGIIIRTSDDHGNNYLFEYF
jgi:hypothetical protein